MHDRARSTLDLDLSAVLDDDLLSALQRAAAFLVRDHFEFGVRAQGSGLAGPPEGGQRFHVDIGIGDLVTAEPEWLPSQVDLALLLDLGAPPDAETREALRVTFGQSDTHPLPQDWPPAPADWAARFAEMADQTGLARRGMSHREERLRCFWVEPRSSDGES